MKWVIQLAIVCVAMLFAATHRAEAAVELITNGGFETGTFAGWTVTDAGSGSFFVDAPATTTPVSGFPTLGGPTNGSFYAVSDQSGPGTHALVQSFAVPTGVSALTLSFDMFVNDQSLLGPIINPAGLTHTAGPNQHARVDVLTAGAAAFSTSPADVVANFYLGIDPPPNPNPFTSYSFDLLAAGLVGGTSYQLRFAEVDNQLFFHQGVDNVSIQAASAAVPEPSSLVVFAGLLSIGLVGLRRRNPSTSV